MKIEKILQQIGIEIFGITDMPPEQYLIPCRAKSRLPKDAKSVIIAAFPYFSSELKGNISKYAMVEDYHKVVGAYLEKAVNQLHQSMPGIYVWFTDNSPIPEVYTAARAGLGVIGKNGLLIHRQYGSYVFLGEIVTNQKLDTNNIPLQSCDNCGCCQSNCPTQARNNDKFEQQRCLSYVTQCKREPSPEMAEKIQNNGLIWGCDVCQDCCPLNQNIAQTPIAEFQTNIIGEIYPEELEELVQTRAFGFRGIKVLQRNIRMIQEKNGNNAIRKTSFEKNKNKEDDCHAGKRYHDTKYTRNS